MHKLTTTLLALSALTLNGCVIVVSGWDSSPRIWIEETEEFEIPLDDISTLWVKGHNGHIAARGDGALHDRAHVTVSIRAGGRDLEDARACMEALELQSSPRGTTYELTTEWTPFRKQGWQAVVDYDIEMPQTVALEAKTHNGAVTVEGLRRSCRLRTHNGKIAVADLEGEVDARSHNGEIALQAVAPAVTLRTHNAFIDADLQGVPAPRGHIKTHNGSVAVVLGDQASTRLDCQSHNGSITCGLDLKEAEVRRHSFSGVLGTGEGHLTIRTHNGNIHVDQ